MHATAAFVSMLMLGALVCRGLFGDLVADSLTPPVWLGWTALVVSFIALAACLWDVTLRTPVFGLYLLGLVAVGMTVDHFDLTPAADICCGWVRSSSLHVCTRRELPVEPPRGTCGDSRDALGIPRGRRRSPLRRALRWPCRPTGC